MAIKQDKFNIAQLSKQYSIAASVLKNDPSLIEALNKIMGSPASTSTGIAGLDAVVGTASPMITDPGLQEQIIKATSWWKNQTDKQRQYAYAKETNPGQFAADLQTNATSVAKMFHDSGLNITAEDAIAYADKLMQQSVIINGKVITYDAKYISKLMANAIDFTHTGKINTQDKVVYTNLSGNLETLASSLYKQAWDYGFPQTMSNDGFTNWFETNMKGLISGDINKENVDNQLQQRAKSFAPGLSNLIDQGQTLRQAADPWLQAIATTWDLYDASTIDLNDPTVQQVLNTTDEKGNVRPVNLYDAKKIARRSPNWDMTQNAKEEKTGIASRILKDFGFLG
jgi:hypothetical protein